MEDSVDVSDFFFHNCRKFRLFAGSTKYKNASRRTRLASSSHFGVTFAVLPENQVVCFPTKSIVDYKLSKENMNVEVTDLKLKKLNFAAVDVINEIGVNSDGTLLAILHTTNDNVFVEVHDIPSLCTSTTTSKTSEICKIRVGTDPSNRGSALEWNPAFPDTFAATSSDHSIAVVKLDRSAPGKHSILGSAKLGGEGTAISWSPKGKQLSIGDSCGKVVQLKPELGVVRSVLPPDNVPNYRGVTGLCWLATTEWMVSFSKNETGTEHDTYIMKCKKDKPTEWLLLNELSYSNPKSTHPANLFASTSILVDWNVILVANTRTSQIVPVGKMAADWQTWTVDEGKEVYLPTTSSRGDTFPIGITIDRSMDQEVLLGFDGTSNKHRPAPILMCLTDDGVLTAYHIISNNPAHSNCQIKSTLVTINDMKAVETSVKPVEIASPVLSTPVKPAVEVVKEKTPNVTSLFSTPPQPMFTSVPSIPISKPEVEKSVETPKVEVVNAQKEVDLSEKKKELIEYISTINKLIKEVKEEGLKLSFAGQNTRKAVTECSEVVRGSLEDSREVLDELKVLIESIKEVSKRTIHSVEEMDFELDEKKSLIAELSDPEMIMEVLRSNCEAEKIEKFNKLEKSADLLAEKFVKCNDVMKQVQKELSEKEQSQKHSVLSPMRNNQEQSRYGSGLEVDVTLKVMRNVSKIIMDTKEKLQRNELELAMIQKQKRNENMTQSVRGDQASIPILQGPPIERNDHQSQSWDKKLTNEEVLTARKAIFAKIKARGAQKIRNVKIESYKVAEIKEETDKNVEEMNTFNLSTAIMKLSMTPRRVMATSTLFSGIDEAAGTPKSVKRDATTQADEPPVVKTVTVTVESDVKKVAPPAETTIAKPMKNAGTTTTSTSTAPQPSSKLTTDFLPKIPSVFSSLFSTGGSSFKTQPVAPVEQPKIVEKAKNTPIFEELKTQNTPQKAAGTSLFSPKPIVEEPKVVAVKEVEKKDEKAVEEVKEPKKVEVMSKVEETVAKKEDLPVPEPSKVEAATPEASKIVLPSLSPAQPVAELPKPQPVVELPQKPVEPSSFSFTNPTTTPKPLAASSSIFGGGSGGVGGGANSMFGGGVKTGATSPFGSFGQQGATSPAAPVSFSFNTAKPAAAPSTMGFGSFGAATAAKPSGFAAAAAAAASQDDGMEDDSMNPTASSTTNSPFGGGFMGGLGSSGSTNTSSNIFGNKSAAPTGGQNTNSWLFGGGGGNQQQNQSQQPKSTSFSFAAAQHAQQTSSPATSSGFGGAPKFGGQPAFGAKPAFGGGAAPGGGVLSKNSSIFGTSGVTTGGTGFAQFASSGTTFGAAAQAGTSSIFGGSTKPAGTTENSIFGGAAKPNSSFGSWR